MTGVQKDTKWKIKLRPDLEKGAGGDIQVLDMQQRGQRQVRVVNVYDALRQSDKTRPARYADWAHIINANTILAGDCNAHSPRWNPQCTTSTDHLFLEGLMDDHDLRYVGDGQETHRQTGQQRHSVLDMVFTTMELEPHTTACKLDDPAHATLSDHEAIWWVVDTGRQTDEPNLITRGWAVSEWLENKDRLEAAEKEWHSRCSGRPVLDTSSTPDDIQNEAEWIWEQLTEMLNKYARKIKIMARSKRWWGPEIKAVHQQYGRVCRDRQRGMATLAEERAAQRTYKRLQCKQKRCCWVTFLDNANGDEVWDVLRCTKACMTSAIGITAWTKWLYYWYLCMFMHWYLCMLTHLLMHTRLIMFCLRCHLIMPTCLCLWFLMVAYVCL
jgi:hypothetical protein